MEVRVIKLLNNEIKLLQITKNELIDYINELIDYLNCKEMYFI